MIIDIDTEILIEYGITAHHWIVAKLLHDKNYIHLTTYLDQTEQDIEEVTNKLVKARLIENTNSSTSSQFYATKLLPTARLKNILMKGDFFDEFLSLYPVKVMRTDGAYDYLRKDLDRARRTYNKLVNKSKIKHNHIIKCLSYELEKRKKHNQMAYMKRLPKWLASREYETYEQEMIDKKVHENASTSQPKYGESIL